MEIKKYRIIFEPGTQQKPSIKPRIIFHVFTTSLKEKRIDKQGFGKNKNHTIE